MRRPPIIELGELDRYAGRIPLAELQSWVEKSSISLDQVQPFLRFADDHYVRNLIYAGPSFQALVLCWHSGQRSPIHDHRSSSCAVKILSGVATETSFALAPNGMVYATASRLLTSGDWCASQDADIHQMSNLQPLGHDLVTLHIYSPPLFRMNMYSLLDAKVQQFFDPVNEEFASGAGI